MKHRATSRFWSRYNDLPKGVRALADKNFALLKSDPRHPSLHLKKIGRYWSIRVGLRYRAFAVEAKDTLVWFWIGTYAEYDQMMDELGRG